MAVKIFFCYAHEDEALLNKLKSHLRPLQREGVIELWHDRDISAGTEWEREIDKQLNAAQIILLLVSPDFMNSEYCYSVEMRRAIERHECNEACVIPIILRHVLWKVEPLARLQALPRDAKPVKSWFDEDEALFNVAEGVRKAAEKLSLNLHAPQPRFIQPPAPDLREPERNFVRTKTPDFELPQRAILQQQEARNPTIFSAVAPQPRSSSRRYTPQPSRFLWAIVVVLVIVWLMGFLFHIGGAFIHILLIVALILSLYNLLVGGRTRL